MRLQIARMKLKLERALVEADYNLLDSRVLSVSRRLDELMLQCLALNSKKRETCPR